MGVAEFVKADMVKSGAVVVDVGVNRVSDPTAKSGSRLVGDVDFANVQPIAGKITPNPGGRSDDDCDADAEHGPCRGSSVKALTHWSVKTGVNHGVVH